MKTPYADWAISKVEKFTPPSKEKSTLIAIARISEDDGTGCYAKVETIAHRSGHSIRTVQNHLKALQSRCTLPRIGNEDDGSDAANAELRVEYQAKTYYRTNKYHINVCRQINSGRDQMKLALKTKLPMSETTIGEKEPLAPQVQEMINKVLENLSMSEVLKPRKSMFSITADK